MVSVARDTSQSDSDNNTDLRCLTAAQAASGLATHCLLV